MTTRRRGVDSNFIEKVKQANNLVAVANRYMVVRPKGKTHWACCPFHHEKTPSFAINELQQFYHCFGCGVSGDVITLVQQLESLDFYETLEKLAKAAGLEMPAIVHDPEYAQKAKHKQRVLQALEAAREYYCGNLKAENLEYLHNRGINDDLIKLFNIGASTGWDGVIKRLREKGFTEQEMIDAGIAVRNDRGNIYDAMANRITFAIFNLYGDCIGFTGRTTSKEADIAKYKNTSQTIVFDKSSIVYGVDVLKKNKITNFIDRLIVVEGNIDVVSLVGAGFANTVACMGTALTSFHARVFKRFTERIFICFDGDAGGQKATLRGLEILAAENLDVRVVSMPDGSDPDDFIRKSGAQEFEKLLDAALPLIDYKLEHLKKTNPLKDNLDKTKYLKSAVDVLKPLAGTAELELYIPKVAEVAKVSFDAVKKSVGGPTGNAQAQPPGKEECPKSGTSAYGKAIDFVMASVLHSKDYINFGDLTGVEIENFLLKTVLERVKAKKGWKVSCVFDEFDEEEVKQLDNLINYPFKEGDGREKWKSCINEIGKKNIDKQIDDLKERHKQTQDTDEQGKIMVQIQELIKRKKA
jgi:DNA primase